MTVAESAECKSSLVKPHLGRGLAKPENNVMICHSMIISTDWASFRRLQTQEPKTMTFDAMPYLCTD